MSKKAAARAARKAEEFARFEATKSDLVKKVCLSPNPIVAQGMSHPSGLPKISQQISLDEIKKPKAEEIRSRFPSRMTWCDRKKDTNGSWTWGEQRKWSQEEWAELIEPRMNEFGALTWKEIDGHSSDTGHKMHHGHLLVDLIGEAQSRWLALELDQFEEVFRFRLGNKKRAWGFIVQAHFCLVWWERDHNIYPV